MLFTWEEGERHHVASGASRRSFRRYWLVVERLPDSCAWDWVVWRKDAPERKLSGGASSAFLAVASAQDAAKQLEDWTLTPTRLFRRCVSPQEESPLLS